MQWHVMRIVHCVPTTLRPIFCHSILGAPCPYLTMPPIPIPTGNYHSVFSVYEFLFLCLFVLLVALSFISHI